MRPFNDKSLVHGDFAVRIAIAIDDVWLTRQVYLSYWESRTSKLDLQLWSANKLVHKIS
jgi:hypothetical protein